MAKQVKNRRKNGSHPVWIIPFSLIIILMLSVGGYYVYGAYDQYLENQQLIRASIQASVSVSIQESSQEESRIAEELAAMRQVLDQATFYPGIYIDDLILDGKTYQEIQTELRRRDDQWLRNFGAALKLGDQVWPLTGADAGLTSDWQAILDQAWQTGRTSNQVGAARQIRERYAVVQELKKKPLHLSVSQLYDARLVRTRIISLADSLYIEAVGAKATGFNLTTKKFTITDQKPGRTVDGESCAKAVIKLLDAGQYGQTVDLNAVKTTAGMDAANILSHVGYVSQGITYARAVNPNRDNNITLICQMLNGLVLQPGETFSFNGTIGERTAAKGFMEAGGIKDGILIQELGGGICQPNTTLCHAVLKADLEIVERHPHSWPSDYVAIGLDATVSWRSPDFKFRNNTEYPLAIVATYKKPGIVIQIYGRLLESGVTITLESEHNGFIPVDPPLEKYNPALKPGQRVEIRAPHIGQRATGYKVWMKNGTFIKREVAFTSYYRPIRGSYEYGPPAPTPKPTTAPTTTAPTTTAPTTTAPTTTASTTATTTASTTATTTASTTTAVTTTTPAETTTTPTTTSAG